MLIKKMKLSDLKPAPYNPRVDLQPGDPEYEQLKRSVLEFGLVETIVFNQRTGYVVGGHQRLKVLEELGYEELDVSVVDLSDDQEKALNVALNKISGDWDVLKLKDLLDELGDSGYDVALTGFESGELEEMLDSLPQDTELNDPVEEDNFDVEQALEDIKEPETKHGDVWKLGRHLLVCGDATKISDIDKLMGEDKADLVITDPPYNVAIKSDSAELNESGRGLIMNDDMSDADFDIFLDEVFRSYAHLMSDAAGIYVFHGSSYQREFQNAMNANGLEIRQQCIWVKNAPAFGWSQYRWQHEPCFYAFKKGKAPSWYGGRTQSTVWRAGLLEDVPEPSTVWEVSRGNINNYVHPTQKPLELIAIPLVNSSKKGDIVVDLFGGSGSTLMTCEQTDRECRTLELDPVFCDVIKRRFYESAGIEPVLVNG
ncbi:site-specific DNA-methyltransferase [Sporosarcina sp. FSL K6-1508]|uniref:site-specific DNA-methyltransferase n=1 Tax=Sporosarcina sp. FSL K6-1508 TaxID=2921553 RepID=UPI0030FABCDA